MAASSLENSEKPHKQTTLLPEIINGNDVTELRTKLYTKVSPVPMIGSPCEQREKPKPGDDPDVTSDSQCAPTIGNELTHSGQDPLNYGPNCGCDDEVDVDDLISKDQEQDHENDCNFLTRIRKSGHDANSTRQGS